MVAVGVMFFVFFTSWHKALETDEGEGRVGVRNTGMRGQREEEWDSTCLK